MTQLIELQSFIAKHCIKWHFGKGRDATEHNDVNIKNSLHRQCFRLLLLYLKEKVYTQIGLTAGDCKGHEIRCNRLATCPVYTLDRSPVIYKADIGLQSITAVYKHTHINIITI